MQVACPHAADNEKRNRPFIQHEIKTRSHIEHGQKQRAAAAVSSDVDNGSAVASWCCLCQVALGHVEAELNLIRLFFVFPPRVWFSSCNFHSLAGPNVTSELGDLLSTDHKSCAGLAGNPVGTVTNWSSPCPFLQCSCNAKNEKFAEILHAMRAARISKDLGHELAASVSRARPLGRDGAIVDACLESIL